MRSQERKADANNFGNDDSLDFDWHRQEIDNWRDHDNKEDRHDRDFDFDGEEELELSVFVAFGIHEEDFDNNEDNRAGELLVFKRGFAFADGVGVCRA